MLRRLAALAALAAAIAPAGAAADARLDRSFGDSGWVTDRIGGKKSSSLAYAAAVTGGKVVVAGQTEPRFGKNPQVLVARYRSNGRPDRGFADGGVFVSELPRKRGPYQATGVVPAGSGKLLVAGGYGEGSALAMRLTKRGRPDRSFGKRGIAKIPTGDIAHSILIPDDGSILLGSSNQNDPGRPIVVARLTADGELDQSFGSGGVAQTIFWDPVAASSVGAIGLMPAADGGVTGYSHIDFIGGSGGSSGGHGEAGVFQLTADGEPATGFGAGGSTRVAVNDPGGAFAQWFPCAFGADAQGRIAVTGEGRYAGQNGVLTARLTPAGEIDPAYGPNGDGRAFLPGTENDSDLTCGGSVDAGGALTIGTADLIARLTPEGAADPGFGPGGIVEAKKPKGVTINALEPAGAGRVVVAGNAKGSLYLARYRVP